MFGGFKYNIRVIQLDCDDPRDRLLVTPVGCSQYFTDQSHIIQSITFDSRGTNQYMPGLNYAICLRRPDAACEVTYKRDSTVGIYSKE